MSCFSNIDITRQNILLVSKNHIQKLIFKQINDLNKLYNYDDSAPEIKLIYENVMGTLTSIDKDIEKIYRKYL